MLERFSSLRGVFSVERGGFLSRKSHSADVVSLYSNWRTANDADRVWTTLCALPFPDAGRKSARERRFVLIFSNRWSIHEDDTK
jgi:hypothetical protein